MIHPSSRGKGAIPTPSEIKASHFILGAPFQAPNINWEAPFDVEQGFVVTQTDQGPSLRCTSDGTAYYGEARNKRKNGRLEHYSRRHIYSQSFIPPEGGAQIWKAMSIPVKQAFVSMTSVPDPDPLTEQLMRDTSLNGNAISEAIPYKYAQIPNYRDIDRLAEIIQNYDGFVTGFIGNDFMFSGDGTLNPINQTDWGHCVWACGHAKRHHLDSFGKLIHANERMIKFKNSWSHLWGSNGYGYIPECFIKAGMLFDAYVYAEISDIIVPMKERITLEGTQDQYTLSGEKIKLIPDLETLSLLVEQGVVGGGVRAVNEDEFNKFVKEEPWPSVKVNRAARDFFHSTIDSFTDQ